MHDFLVCDYSWYFKPFLWNSLYSLSLFVLCIFGSVAGFFNMELRVALTYIGLKNYIKKKTVKNPSIDIK